MGSLIISLTEWPCSPAVRQPARNGQESSRSIFSKCNRKCDDSIGKWTNCPKIEASILCVCKGFTRTRAVNSGGGKSACLSAAFHFKFCFEISKLFMIKIQSSRKIKYVSEKILCSINQNKFFRTNGLQVVLRRGTFADLLSSFHFTYTRSSKQFHNFFRISLEF